MPAEHGEGGHRYSAKHALLEAEAEFYVGGRPSVKRSVLSLIRRWTWPCARSAPCAAWQWKTQSYILARRCGIHKHCTQQASGTSSEREIANSFYRSQHSDFFGAGEVWLLNLMAMMSNRLSISAHIAHVLPICLCRGSSLGCAPPSRHWHASSTSSKHHLASSRPVAGAGAPSKAPPALS